MTTNTGSPFPSASQALLLKAAILQGNKMLSAWNAWKSKVNFETDVEHASFRMLPLLYHNLHKQGIQDELMPRLKGIYRQSWSKNHILFHKTGKVLAQFQSVGIPTIVMKGVALSILVYKNNSVRPMADMDILIPKAFALQTIAFLKDQGWKIQDEQYLDYNLKYGRSATFCDDKQTELDLHWHPVFEAHEDIEDDDFWNEAVPLVVAGIQTKSFCATDNLFHAIVHGMRYNPEPPIRWIADAMALINSKEAVIDWKRLVHHTEKFRVYLQMSEALNYLKKNFDASIPKNVFRDINAIKPRFSDKVVYHHAKKYGDKDPETVYQRLYSVYAGYLRQSNETSFARQHIDFVKYLRFRTKGKPYFRVLGYYISLLFKRKNQANKT